MKRINHIKIDTFRALFLTLLILQLSLMIFFGYKKQGFFVDEVWTYGLSNSYYHPHVYSNGALVQGWLDPSYFGDYLSVNDGERFSYDSVKYNQTNDVHPPLYYDFVHTVCSLFPNQFSKWFGLVVNFLFMIISSVILYLLAKELLGEKWMALCVMVVYGFSVGAMDTTMLIRMYAMLTCSIIATTYVHMKLISDTKHSWIIPVAVITYLGFMTQYTYLFYAFFLSGFTCFYIASHKKYKFLVQYIIAVFVGLLLGLITFPAAWDHNVHGSRGAGGLASGFDFVYFCNSVKSFASIINKELFGGWFLVLLALFLILCMACMVRKRLKAKDNTKEIVKGKKAKKGNTAVEYGILPGILLATVMSFFMISEFAPYNFFDRYIFYLYPMIILLAISGIYLLLKMADWNKVYVWVIVALLFGGLTIPSYMSGVGYLYPEQKEYNETAEKYSDKYAVFVYSDGQEYYATCYATQLRGFQGVLPINVRDLDYLQPFLDEMGITDGCVVYINQNAMDEEQVIQQIIDKTNFQAVDRLFYWDGDVCYYHM